MLTDTIPLSLNDSGRRPVAHVALSELRKLGNTWAGCVRDAASQHMYLDQFALDYILPSLTTTSIVQPQEQHLR
jgi:hypothetical protein